MPRGRYALLTALALMLSLIASIPVALAQPAPSGVVTVDTLEVTVTIPPGGYYAVFYDPQANVLKAMPLPEEWLPAKAVEALEKVPDWIKPMLKRQFYELMKADLVVSGNSTVSAADFNGDGLVDLAVGGSNGTVHLYVNVGSPTEPRFKPHAKINVGEAVANASDACPYLADLDGDGLVDIVVGLRDGSLIFYRNTGTPEAPSWVPAPEYLAGVSVRGNAAPFAFDADADGDLDLAVGSGEGLIYCFRNNGTPAEPSWVLDRQYFPAWIEDWWDGRGPHYEGVWVGNFSKPFIATIEGTEYLFIGVDDGKIYVFKNTGSTGYPTWSKVGELPDVELGSYAAPCLADVNGDSLPDLLIGAGDGKVYLILNRGSATKPLFKVWRSGAEEMLLANWFWGPAYYPDIETVVTVETTTRYVDYYAEIILNTTEPYVDEVAYAIACDRPANLKMLADKDSGYLYQLNAESIYDMASKVAYAEIAEKGDYSTLRYKTEDGWAEAPREVYYKYLVMFNRYIIAPWAWPDRYNGYFFRTFLPYDKLYNVSLFERVANASTLYEAAYLVDYWLRVDIGAWWHPGPKPPGWYNIYLHLRDPNAGIWCGEFSIIYEVAARAMLIPTINVVNIAEDHQFNNFWYEGWHHVDASSGSCGVNGTWVNYFDSPDGYVGTWWENLGGFTYPMEWEEDGVYDVPWRSKLPYCPPDKLANLHFYVHDRNGRPIDGARVEVWSHWTIESGYDTAPYIGGFNFTDMTGRCSLYNVGIGRTNNFTIVVTSRIGSTMFEAHIEEPGDYYFDVTIDGELPEVAGVSEQVTPAASAKYINVSVEVIGAEQEPPCWIDILYRFFNYKYYYVLKGGYEADVYVVSADGFTAFLENVEFPAYAAFDDVVNASLAYLPVGSEAVYVVVSNRESTATSVTVKIKVALLEDVEAPVAIITSPADGALINSSDVVIDFTSTSPDVAYFEVSVDGGDYFVATPPVVISGLADGVHTASVRAVDVSGNVGEAATVTFTVDTTPPIIVLETVASGMVFTTPTITVTGRAIGAVKAWVNGVEVPLVNETFTASVTLSEGANVVVVSAVDAAGNIAVRKVTVFYRPELATKSDVEEVKSYVNATADELRGYVNETIARLAERLEDAVDSLLTAISQAAENVRELTSTRISELKEDVSALKQDVASLGQGQEKLEEDVSALSGSTSTAMTAIGGLTVLVLIGVVATLLRVRRS